eukprot:4199124-Prorocentrum_lima.AAC.1
MMLYSQSPQEQPAPQAPGEMGPDNPSSWELTAKGGRTAGKDKDTSYSTGRARAVAGALAHPRPP